MKTFLALYINKALYNSVLETALCMQASYQNDIFTRYFNVNLTYKAVTIHPFMHLC